MILLTDTDGKPVVVNPEYLVGAHQVGEFKTEINMVGDMVYTVMGTPEDLIDQWAGIGEYEYEYEEEEDGPTEGRGAEQDDSGELVRVSGVPYAVTMPKRGCPSHD